MKILLINYEFPPLGGGAGNATENIAKELASSGHEVSVLTTWFQDLPEIDFKKNYKIVRVKSRRKKLFRSNSLEMVSFALAAIKKIEMVKEFKPDFSISFFSIPSGFVSYYFKRKMNTPYIVSLRGGDVPGFLPKNLKYYHLLTNGLTKLIWKNSISIIANSEGLKELAQKTAQSIKKNVAVVPNGVDANIFNSPDQINVMNKIKLLFVGRLVVQKRVGCLIHVLKDVINDGLTNIYCEIIGDGPLKIELLTLARRYEIEKHVKFLGWVDRNCLAKYYQNADIFVLPSSDEGMPNVLLEAMACALPIIASNIPGNNELVKHEFNGILFSNRRGFAKAIRELAKNKKMIQKMGKNSLELSKRYSWLVVAEMYVNIYKKSLG
jgi:glycosyltransferase involved in cell wall biosynthesis